ncbi:Phosphoserine phosphatase [Golovinomyces cichoracearum]|uniref:phosphoserine phosphatase n=1 Tax=Golovinomyces cichoracearum TaxID=62708 RepID=A0A420IA79_9PEZI|nr:Phosphoserine phosphatase [Golovinomyces cichoracearum]
MCSNFPSRHVDGRTQTTLPEQQMSVKISKTEKFESSTVPALPSSKKHETPRLDSNYFVATLMYRTKTSHQVRSSSNIDCSVSHASDFDVASSACPDNGLYISSVCLTSFLNMISSALENEGSSILDYSHKFLDKPAYPLVVEFVLHLSHDHGDRNLSNLRRHDLVRQFERDWNLDIIIQRETVFRRHPRLVCFDMDSTLIEEEVIDLLAASIGVEAEVSAITKKAMNGEIDFFASLTSRAKLLEGVEEKVFTELRNVITPTQGVRDLFKALKRLGVRTAVFSGGFLPVVSWLAQELGIDYAYANILSVSNHRLTGELEGDVVDAKRKRDLLYEIAEKEGIAINQTVAVGDGANDLMMLEAAGLGIAWNAKPIVQEQANAKLNGDSLLDLLYFFGFAVEEINSLIS